MIGTGGTPFVQSGAPASGSAVYVSLATIGVLPVLYVAPDGSGSDTASGFSPGTPLATIQHAIDTLNLANSRGQIILLPGRHTTTDTITKRQGIEILGATDRPVAGSAGGAEIYYNGPDDGRYAIETAFSDASDDSHGRITGIRVTCTAGYTLAKGIHWRNAQNLSRLKNVFVNAFPAVGIDIDDKQATATNTMPGYVLCEQVWVNGGVTPWHLRMGFTSILFSMCAADGDATTTDHFVVDPPTGATAARGGKDGGLIFIGFKAEESDTAGGAGDSNFITVNTDASLLLLGCHFRKTAGNSVGKFMNYTVAPGSLNARAGTIPVEIINCTTQDTLHLVSAPAVTPAIVVDSPNAAAGEVHQFSWSGGRDIVKQFSTLLSTAPVAPAAGAVTYAKTVASRAVLAIRGATGAERVHATSQWSRLWQLVTPQNSTNIRTTGTGSVPGTPTGTVSTPAVDKTFGQVTQIASAASLNGIADLILGAPAVARGAAADAYAGFFLHSRVRYPDSSYDNTGATTGSRLWGLGAKSGSEANTYQNPRGGTQSICGFNRENVNGGNTDTNWQFVTDDNASAATVADTTMPFTAGHVYEFFIWCPAGSATIFWQVNDVTAGTTASGSATQTLPAVATFLQPFAGLLTIDATVRNFQFARVYAEVDQG